MKKQHMYKGPGSGAPLHADFPIDNSIASKELMRVTEEFSLVNIIH